MAWFKIDDGLDTHEKVEETSLAATGLWVRAGSYAARHLTDGFVPDRWFAKRVPRRRERERLIDELVAETRLIRQDGGCLLHDYLDYNPSREKIEAEREREREKKARGRSRQRQDRIPWESPGDNGALSRGERQGESLSTRPDPTRPDPNSKGGGRTDEGATLQPPPDQDHGSSGGNSNGPVVEVPL